jgi:glycosyltransferase involved in cell wall biosynthesis
VSSTRHLKVLFITPGPVPPPTNERNNQYYFLARYLDGDVISTTWAQTEKARIESAVASAAAMGGIRYHAMRVFGMHGSLKPLRVLWYFVRTGHSLSKRHGPYDVIVTYGALTTGIAGVVLKYLTRARLVVDMPGHPFRGLALQGGAVGHVKARLARILVPMVLRHADGVKLLYPSQLNDLRLHYTPRVAVFHDFTVLRRLDPKASDSQYILLLGHPWYLKGVDVLIRAFLRISEAHPNHRLVIVGHCPDRTPFERLAAGHERIEFRRAVFPAEAAELIGNCSILALPSRTEAMGRVVLEAFAARKPVVASRVDGLPHIIDDGRSGLLCEPEDPNDLARQLDRLLSDPKLADRIASAGYADSRERFSEERFANAYSEFLNGVVRATP